MYSSAYHLLDGKTQMMEESKENEIRSRMEHTNNVADISKRIIGRVYDLCSIPKISKTDVFQLNKKIAELYAEITALSHDLGHTPFGHAGEAVMNEFMQSIKDKEMIAKIIERRKEVFGEKYEEEQGHTVNFSGNLSFEHNEQSAIEFYKIIERNPEEFNQVDIRKIIKGILAHSITRVREVPDDLIAQIVRQTDKIEYRNYDYKEIMSYIKYNSDEEDLIQYQSIPAEERIATIIEDIANEAVEKGRIPDDNNALKMCKRLRKKYENIIYFIEKDGKRDLLTGDNREREQMICKKLLEYYYQNPEKIPTKAMVYNNPLNSKKEKERVISFDKTKNSSETLGENVIEYVSTFTNKKCFDKYKRLVKERIVKGQGYGIEPITQEQIEERKKIQIEERIAKIKGNDVTKERGVRTDGEYRSILQMQNQKFFENDLTEEGKKVIEENRVKHQKENEEDELLWWMVKKADAERVKKFTKELVESTPKRIEMKEEDKELEL